MSSVCVRKFIVLLLFSCILTSCTTFGATSENSQDVKGEVVQVKMLTIAQMREHQELWEVAFAPRVFPKKDDVAKAAFAPIIAIVGSFAVEAAVGFAARYIEKEAKLYEAQFTGNRVYDDFWERDKMGAPWVPRYYGFEINRETSKYQGDTPAFRLIFGIAPQYDRRQFLAAPLKIETRSSRSKVARSGEIRQRAQVTLISNWVSGAERKLITLADTSVQLPNANVAPGPTVFSVKPVKAKNEKQLPLGAALSFASVPRSDGTEEDKLVVRSGEIRLRIVVTQSDASNAKESIEEIRDLVVGKKDSLSKAMSDLITKKLE